MAETPCRSVNVIDVPAQSPNNYTNVFLNLRGHVVEVVRAYAVADVGDPRFDLGGQISGIVDGRVFSLEARSLGAGDNVPGDFSASHFTFAVTLDELPLGATLSLSSARDLFVSGENNGTIHFDDGRFPTFLTIDNISGFEGTSTGDILADEAFLPGIQGPSIKIGGNMDGDILTNLDATGTGVNMNKIVIEGVFNGNLCGSNLMPGVFGGVLPSKFNIVFGPKGTICGQPACPDIRDFDENAFFPRLILVDPAAAGSNLGTSWVNAYIDIDDAIAEAASGRSQEIWVVAGIYTPTQRIDPLDPRSVAFRFENGVQIYGGFVGGEQKRCERDPVTNLTILSGDLNGDDLPGFLNIDENAYHVIYFSSVPHTSFALNGFVISGGNSDTDVGGGYFNVLGSPMFTNCVFRGNSALFGGAVYNLIEAHPTFTNCVFTGNRATAFGGGAVHNSGESNPKFVNCTFSGNTAMAGSGGAVRNTQLSAPTFTNCIVWENTDSSGTGLTAQISNDATSSALVTYSDVQDDQPNDGIVYPCTQSGCTGGVGNLDVDPQFADRVGADGVTGTDDDNLRLIASSPTIEAGDTSSVTVATDLDGNPRVKDADSADPGTGEVDMGAYEFQCEQTQSPTIDTQVESGFATARMIAVLPGNPGDNNAMRVSLVQSGLFPDAVESPPRQWWVGQPFQVCENSGDGLAKAPPNCGIAPGLPQRWFWAARTECGEASAHYMDWTVLDGYCTGSGESCTTSGAACAQGTCGVNGVVHIFGRAIVPSGLANFDPQQNVPETIYEIQTINDACNPTDESHFSAPLVVEMARWGDIVDMDEGSFWSAPDGEVEIITDAVAVLEKFSNAMGAPIKSRSDIDPEFVNTKVDILDVLKVVDAFEGENYPFAEPCDCDVSCP